MKTENLHSHYRALTAQLMEQERIACDIENHESDVVNRARQEVERIKRDIANLLGSTM